MAWTSLSSRHQNSEKKVTIKIVQNYSLSAHMENRLVSFLNDYNEDIRHQTFSESCLETCKRINRSFALLKMSENSENIEELMLIYNMAAHFSPQDPAGVYHALQHLSGPTKVNCEAFGKLLVELSTVTKLTIAELKI